MQQINKKAVTLAFAFGLLLVIVVKAQIITTVVGNGIGGYSGDGGAAASASLFSPTAIALDASGNLFISDQSNQRIRKVTPTGVISTVAGNGTRGYNGDGLAATSASLNYPSGVAVDAVGNLYIADGGNNRIRKVDTNGFISTVAGNGNSGYVGDGGVATSASLFSPAAIALDAVGNLYIADGGNHRIRKVNSNGIISTVVGNGIGGYSGDGGAATSASLNSPIAIAVDATGNLYVADWNNHRIRKVNISGVISTVAGNGIGGYSGDGGAATNASLYLPYGVTVDALGNLYIGDNLFRIRKVNPNGGISTVAGNGSFGYSGDGGSATSASLTYPTGLVIDASGSLSIADQYSNRIRKVTGLVTLPIQLQSFTTHQQNNTLNLSWQTTNEVNTSHFIIQRSVDGTNFSEIDKVAAKGDGSYSYTDNQLPSATIVYYRLQMVDKDGSFTYSKVVSCKLTDASKTLAVYPNPVKDHLFVQIASTKAEKITLQITDLQGKLLQQEDTQVGVGNVSLSVNTSALAKGSYILLVKGSCGVQQKQFVKE